MTNCCTIEHTPTVERYLKALFENRGGISDVARALGVAPPTVTAMVHRLRDSDLVEPDALRLTAHGLRHAHGAVRRHRLLETFLHDVLGVKWDEVHTEAEKLEFGLSERLEDLIDARLGHPRRDPHGDPIPPKEGVHHEGTEMPLALARPGERFRVLRVTDRDPGALRALASLRVGLGAEFEVVAEAAGTRRVRTGDRDLVLSAPVVRVIRGELTT